MVDAKDKLKRCIRVVESKIIAGVELRPELQKSASQHFVQECNLVLSPITMQPGSHTFEQFRSRSQSDGNEVELPVLMVSEILFT